IRPILAPVLVLVTMAGLALLAVRSQAQGPGNDPRRPPDHRESARRAAELELLELKHDVDKTLLREVLVELGHARLALLTARGVDEKQTEQATIRLQILQKFASEKEAEFASEAVELHLGRIE